LLLDWRSGVRAEAMRRDATDTAFGNAAVAPAAAVVNASGTATMVIRKMRRRMVQMLRQFQDGISVVEPCEGRMLARHQLIYNRRHDRHPVEAVGEGNNRGTILRRAGDECFELVVVTPMEE
jgi:hypothetical protein